MDEYREIVNLPTVRLGRDDLIKLEEILRNGLSCSESDVKIEATFGARRIIAKSMREFLEKAPATENDNLGITIWSRHDSTGTDAGVTLTLFKNYAQFHLHAEKEALFYGMRDLILRFFSIRRPWYTWIRFPAMTLTPNLTLLTFGAAVYYFLSNSWWHFALISSACTLFAATSYLLHTNRLFPQVSIDLSGAENRRSYTQIGYTILNVLAMLSTIVTTVLAILKG